MRFPIRRRYAPTAIIAGLRVLIVEGEPYMAEASRDGLRLEAIAADIAGDGDTAVELLSVKPGQQASAAPTPPRQPSTAAPKLSYLRLLRCVPVSLDGGLESARATAALRSSAARSASICVQCAGDTCSRSS